MQIWVRTYRFSSVTENLKISAIGCIAYIIKGPGGQDRQLTHGGQKIGGREEAF